MNEAICQCRAVRIPLPTLNPPTPMVFNCHCRQCREQSSSAFGTSAIYPDLPMPVDTQPLGVFTRETNDPSRVKDCYFCTKCGVRIVHRSRGVDEPREEAGATKKYAVVEGREISVKGGCIPGLDWSGAIHIFCEEAVVNLEFPEGVQTFVKDTDSPRWGLKSVRG